MKLPNDPIMLLSFVNTQLRDNYSTLEELAVSYDADQSELVQKLEKAGYHYNADINQFIAASAK